MSQSRYSERAPGNSYHGSVWQRAVAAERPPQPRIGEIAWLSSTQLPQFLIVSSPARESRCVAGTEIPSLEL